ncbi:hypothetical protein HDV03_000326 [Kappamyces sp. JEL0829]|nr:hypothetical protein HDV03_000326 [Kappamyces sp. JEL0829]
MINLPRLTFLYTAKGVSTEYKIRIDIAHLSQDDFDDEFKLTNSVYPKAALVTRNEYKGNRWEYETSVNDIGWKLSWQNPVLLGKRGLLQRAVDSYRNTNPESKSRRVARVEKTLQEKNGGGEDGDDESPLIPQLSASSSLGPATAAKRFKPAQKKRSLGISLEALSDHAAAALQEQDFSTTSSVPMARSGSANSHSGLGASTNLHHGTTTPVGLRLGLQPSSASATPLTALPYPLRPPSRSATASPRAQDSRQRLIVETVKNSAPYQFRLRMDIHSIPENVDRTFVVQNQPFSKPKAHREFLCNSIAWKLAYLNPDILVGNRELLQRSVDVYMEHFEDQAHAPRAGVRLLKMTFDDTLPSRPDSVEPATGLGLAASLKGVKPP